MERLDRTYYPDGQVKEETQYRGGTKHGAQRMWHPNGALARERWYVNGKETGRLRTWFDSGQIQLERDMFNDMQAGRATAYDPDGKVILRCYMVDGHMLTRSAYDKACSHRPDLPEYTDDEPPPDAATLRGSRHAFVIRASASDFENADPDVMALLDGKVAAEALAWLEENRKGRIRFLGHLKTEESIAFVKKLYQLGATRVLAADIVNYTGGQSSNQLLAYPPKPKAARKALFEFWREFDVAQGFDADRDHGQAMLGFKMA
jgi:hypothetical protein